MCSLIFSSYTKPMCISYTNLFEICFFRIIRAKLIIYYILLRKEKRNLDDINVKLHFIFIFILNFGNVIEIILRLINNCHILFEWQLFISHMKFTLSRSSLKVYFTDLIHDEGFLYKFHNDAFHSSRHKWHKVI